MVKKNDSIELFITGYTAEGSGVGRFFPEENTGENSPPDKEGGIAVFVPGAAKGDRLRVRIVKTAKTYAFGRLEEILLPHRIGWNLGALFLLSAEAVFSAIFPMRRSSKPRRSA